MSLGLVYPLRRSLYWIGYFCVLFVVAMAIFEIFLRVFYREEAVNGNYWGIGAFVEDAELGYRHAPHSTTYGYREGVFDSLFVISSDGLRQTNVAEQLQHPEILLLLGDSFTVGLGVTEDEAFPHLLQWTLNPLGIGVINGAQSGYGVEQEVALGISLARKYRPAAIVVTSYPENDIQDDFLKGYKNIDVRYGYRLAKDRLLPVAPVDFLRTHSYAWLYIDGRILAPWRHRRKMADFERLIAQAPKDAAQATLNALRRLRDFTAATGIKFGVMIIPSSRGERFLNGYLRDALIAESISFLDLHGKMFEKEDYFSRDGHWNARGHARAAKYLADFVIDLVAVGQRHPETAQ